MDNSDIALIIIITILMIVSILIICQHQKYLCFAKNNVSICNPTKEYDDKTDVNNNIYCNQNVNLQLIETKLPNMV